MRITSLPSSPSQHKIRKREVCFNRDLDVARGPLHHVNRLTRPFHRHGFISDRETLLQTQPQCRTQREQRK